MDYNECIYINAKFKEEYSWIFNRSSCQGVQIAKEFNKLVLQIVVTCMVNDFVLNIDLAIPNDFAYTYNGTDKSIKVRVVHEEIVHALSLEIGVLDPAVVVRGGDAA